MLKIKNKIKELSDYWFGSFPSLDKACKPKFDKVILPIIRRVMPSIIAHDIIGVQPMTGPSASIFALRAKYAESQKDDENKDKRETMAQILDNTRKQLEKDNENKDN